tara:strand:- start:626 stop:1156 length:531 start_codon:yes stop_codon:yes gene_type:complete
MILTCNSCGKKFVVPDKAITSSGRMVQCGSCGNKWKQFPTGEIRTNQPLSNSPKIVSKPKKIKQTTEKPKKIKKATTKKSREISLYSPEYLAKKHGIKISDTKNEKVVTQSGNRNVSFGFYNSLILFIFLIISISRILYFSQGFIIANFPITEFYLNYFFESIKNMFEIWKDLITY